MERPMKTYLRLNWGKYELVTEIVKVSWDVVEYWGVDRTDKWVAQNYHAEPALPYQTHHLTVVAEKLCDDDEPEYINLDGS